MEQVPEGEVVPQGLLHMADVRIDLPQTVLDFLVRVTGISEGIQLLLGFAEFQTVVANYGTAGRSEEK